LVEFLGPGPESAYHRLWSIALVERFGLQRHMPPDLHEEGRVRAEISDKRDAHGTPAVSRRVIPVGLLRSASMAA
jgi:hypothetical protein